MANNASSFIKNRRNRVSITSDRINHIIWYIAECYSLLTSSKTTYSKSWVNTNTSYHFEDYLKMELVDTFLIKNKAILISRTSALEEINFTYETIKRFTDVKDGIQKNDKIDVYINKLGLKNQWSVEDEHLYLAIECKRIKTLTDCKTYVGDIQNFCDRNYSHLRIPFEGQIAFIENLTLKHNDVAKEVDKILKASTTLITKQTLESTVFNPTFSGGYTSRHFRNFGKKEIFKIFHLMMDYSTLIVK